MNFTYLIEKKAFMEHITLSKATAADWQTIRDLARATFFETFAAGNTEADMAEYLEETFNDTKVQSELQVADSQFYIAWDDKTPVGYLKVNTGPAQTALQDADSLEIERIYVKSSHHGKKVGQVLYEKALEVARHQQKKYIWLGVWEENPRAIRFYEKNGFVAFDKHIFKVGTDEQIDIMMRKELE
ncbi:GNAT family N-acetyltransferase [Chitinophaga agri]|nr:GNAT family N-acetyltransferase [Chitinophaga agri]